MHRSRYTYGALIESQLSQVKEYKKYLEEAEDWFKNSLQGTPCDSNSMLVKGKFVLDPLMVEEREIELSDELSFDVVKLLLPHVKKEVIRLEQELKDIKNHKVDDARLTDKEINDNFDVPPGYTNS